MMASLTFPGILLLFLVYFVIGALIGGFIKEDMRLHKSKTTRFRRKVHKATYVIGWIPGLQLAILAGGVIYLIYRSIVNFAWYISHTGEEIFKD